ncbi:serine acetyltransferase [Clostridium perfringens]|nr:serine acetyltransferase [Clostridium perfringens]MDM0809575.1 serine acetyltransferase [Clostridium perfringens]
MIENRNDLKEYIEYEAKKYGLKSSKTPLFLLREKDILWKYNKILRKAEYYHNTNNRLFRALYKFKLNRLSNKYSIHIPMNTFDKGLKLMHVGPILVNGHVKAGKDISLHINTCIAAGGTNNNAPHLGNNIVVGVGAVILGDVYVPDYCAIGANAVVNKSFSEKNITIAGIPAKKISNNGYNDWK